MSYRYEESSSISKKEFLRIMAEGEIAVKCQAIVSAAHAINDSNWLLHQYNLLLRNPNVEIRGVTVSSIGHLARLSDEVTKGQLLELLEPLLSDSEVAGRVEDAIDDVNMFLK